MNPKSTNYKSLVRFHGSAMVLTPLLLWHVAQCSLVVQCYVAQCSLVQWHVAQCNLVVQWHAAQCSLVVQWNAAV